MLNGVYIDGGITVQQFLPAGLIQRIVITRVKSEYEVAG
jgi:dihydrofolate reductase